MTGPSSSRSRRTSTKHLTPNEIADLLDDRLRPARRKWAARHLLSGCGPCRWRLAVEVPGFFRESGVPEVRRWRRDRQRLARALELIRNCPRGYEGLSFRQAREIQGWPLVVALSELSFAERFRDIKKMRWLAYIAMIAAEDLSSEDYGMRFAFDLRARIRAELANAYRVNEELPEAEESFGRARILLTQGTGDLFLLARVAELEASLWRAQRKLAKVDELLAKTGRLYIKLGDNHLAAKALSSKAISAVCGGRPREAVQLFREAIGLVSPKRDPQLLALCQKNLLVALVDCGEFREAGHLILSRGLRKEFAADPRLLLKLRIIEAKIQAGLGKLASARSLLLEIRSDFLERGEEYAAATVGLELAAVLLRQGKTEQVREVAWSALNTLRRLGVNQEAARALRYLRQV